MRILWLCNIMLPMIAKELHIEASNKEGWLSGLAAVVLERQGENAIELAVAFPAPAGLCAATRTGQTAGETAQDGQATVQTGRTAQILRLSGEVPVCKGETAQNGRLTWYAFAEDVRNPHRYDDNLELQMWHIVRDFQPDVVHCFGTEYPHTLAMCRAFPEKDRLLVGIQGSCKVYADAYFANLPEEVIHRATLRDILKNDQLTRQQYKFAQRGEMEQEAVALAGNVTGRTAWDKHYTAKWNPGAVYHKMNETLRPEFYTGQWSGETCEPYSIFLSQGDYPIKGLHYMLLALPAIREVFPDVKLYVAGNSITGEGSLKKRLKISAYGQYLRELMQKLQLQDRVIFLGRLDAGQMKERYLRSHLFVCCSSIENSPNSLGEAMLLGVPCVSADVGGIPSIFTDGEDGILYEGFRAAGFPEESQIDKAAEDDSGTTLQQVSDNLAQAVLKIWSEPEKIAEYSRNARNHALATHNKEQNYRKLTEIYADIAGKKSSFPRYVMVSNYINHHQIPFCNAMYEQSQGKFVFIQTQPMEEERVSMGWQAQVELPYLKYYYEQPEECRELIRQCPYVLFGGVDDESYIEERLASGKPVMRYSERLYKEGQWKAVSPRGLLKKYHDHTRYRDREVYLFCAGAYVPSDFHIVRAYPGKMLKWGYFPETRHYDVDALMRGKHPGSILWAARFLDWKHPETAINCACYLKGKGLRFHMKVVGDGDQREIVEKMVRENGLEDCVELLGYRTPGEVRALMEETSIYLTTSDRKEGWGAVINEAMNSGCAVVASHMMGAAPWLIKNGENGCLYEDGKDLQLFALVEKLLRDGELTERLGRAAIASIEEEWNADLAAERFLRFCETRALAEHGPCSPAEVVSERALLRKSL